MSASKFFRNFLSLPQMATNGNNCYQPRENGHRDDNPTIQKTQGSAFPAPLSKYKSEIHDPLSIANGSHLRQETVSQVASTTDLSQNLNDDHRFQDLHSNRYRVVGTITAKKMESSFCGTEEKEIVQVNTTTRWNEVKSESTAEHEHKCSLNTEQQITDKDPIEFTNLQVTTCKSLNGCKTEEELGEVTASEGVLDELFQNDVNTLNVATRTNDLEDSHKEASVDREQQEDLDDPLVNVFYRETTTNQNCLQDEVIVEQKQNLKPVQRLFTALQETDPADRGEDSLKKQRRCLGDIANNTFTAQCFSQPTEMDKRACDNINTLAIERGDVESSTGSSPKTGVDFHKTEHLSAGASDDECLSMASSNTEIYDEADYQDFKIQEVETQQAIGKAGDNDAAAAADVPFQFPSQTNLDKDYETGRIIAQELVMTSNHSALLSQSQDNSRNAEINTHPLFLVHSYSPADGNHSTAPSRLADTSSDSVRCSKSELGNEFQRSSDNPLCNKNAPGSNTPIMRESMTLNAMKTKSSRISLKDDSSASVKRKRISVGAGSVYEGEVSQSPAKTQKLLSSDHSLVARDVPSSSTRHSVNSSGTSSSFWNHAHSNVFSVPPGATVFSVPLGATVFSVPPGATLVDGQSIILAQLIQQQLPVSAGLRTSKIHPFKLNNHQIQLKPSLPTAQGGLGISYPNSKLNCTNRRLVSVLKRPSENVYHKVVTQDMLSKVEESQNSNTTVSNQRLGEAFFSKLLNGKKSSRADGMVDDDEVSLCESLQSTTKRTFLSFNNSEGAVEDPALSTRQANNWHSKSPCAFSYVKSTMSSKLPPGSTLVSDRGVYCINSEEKRFGCAYCDKTYTTKQAVFSHIRYRHDDKCYSCEFCDKRYSQECLLLAHMAVHRAEKLYTNYTCDQCNKSFRWKTGLHKHRATHSDERPFPCNKCNKSFKFKSDLGRHIAYHNKVERGEGIACNICKSLYVNRHVLKQHMMIHTGEKPFKCTLCDKQFRLKTNLRYHVDNHNGKKRHLKELCTLCGKSLYSSYMPTHMRMHSGEKPFECSICFKSFPKKSNLEGHMRSHTGEKPFACSGCDKRFALYSNMVTHKAKCTAL